MTGMGGMQMGGMGGMQMGGMGGMPQQQPAMMGGVQLSQSQIAAMQEAGQQIPGGAAPAQPMGGAAPAGNLFKSW